MTKDLNKVMIIGRVGRDPEMNFSSGGRPVARFSVATNRNWKTKSGQLKSETEWFNIVAWGSLAEVCNKFLKKGQRVYIEGRLQTRHWQDDGGVRRNRTEVTANEMIMLSQQSSGKNNIEALDSTREEEYLEGDMLDEDEYPF